MPNIIAAWSPDAATDQRLLELHAYWASLAEDGAVPQRDAFKPAAIRHLLPFVLLIDVLDSGRDFRFRLVGTKFTEAVGQDFTGRTVGEIFPPEFRDPVLEGWNKVVQGGGPNWSRGPMWDELRPHLIWQGLMLPLKSADGITQLLGGAVFVPKAALHKPGNAAQPGQ